MTGIRTWMLAVALLPTLCTLPHTDAFAWDNGKESCTRFMKQHDRRMGNGLRVAFIGDPQVGSEEELSYARHSIYKELSERRDLDFAIFLGDITNDEMGLLKESKAIIDSLPYPSYLVSGNHDRDVYPRKSVNGTPKKDADRVQMDKTMRLTAETTERSRDLATWRKIIGYTDTAFDISRVRFILMNNVRDDGEGGYCGGLTVRQLHFLDSVIVGKKVKPHTIALVTHIPISQSHGKDSILAIFGRHLSLIPEQRRPELLFVSGHTHKVRRDTLSLGIMDGEPAPPPANELIGGATCGSWWRGVKDKDGIPYGLMGCGAPRGYFIADFDYKRKGAAREGRSSYRLRYKVVGRPDDEQMSVNIVSEKDSVGRSGYRIYVNVFGGAIYGKVRANILPEDFRKNSIEPRCGDYQVICLSRCDKPALEVLEVIRYNDSFSRDYKKQHRSDFIPMRRQPSPHLWRSDFIPGMAPARLEVFYSDPFMREIFMADDLLLTCSP